MVATAHRFLHGRTPRTPEKQIWVLSGQVQDWFYHDLLRGCLTLRASLERWAMDGGLALTVMLDRNGILDFSGNDDEDDARHRFDASRSRRPPRYGSSRLQAPEAPAPAATDGAEDDPDAARRAQAAQQAREAAGGAGQAILNTAGRLTHLLQSPATPSLVIVDEFPELLRRLASNQQTATVAEDLVALVRNEWHGKIAHAHRLVFLSMNPQAMEAVLPRAHFRKVDWRNLEGPRTPEIRGAIERFTRRRSVAVQGIDAISRALESHGNLQVALTQVIRVVAAGERQVTLERVLQRPPLNEDEVRRVLREVDALTGLEEVKEKVRRLERNARTLRRKLLEGDPDLPDDSLHLVFTGGPGTGKTTVARLVARLYHALGLLPRDEVREVVASTLMSSNVGETRENMQRGLEEARGGVLFIDEAHQFGERESLQAREAVQALVPIAWNHRHEMVIVLAGYAERMHDFFAMDPGLERRFPPHGRMVFRDYLPHELWTMLERRIAARGYTLEAHAAARLRSVLERRARRRSFGNAGGVENLVAEVLERHGASPEASNRAITVEHLPPLVRRDEQALGAAMARLDEMVGLEPVRERIRSIMARLTFDLEEEEHGEGTGRVRIHPGNMLFTGPPGTGKTTVGELMAPLLCGIGVIDRPVGVLVSRGDLVGAYQGHSARAVRDVVDRARDGVMFVDEAYALVQGEGDTFGKEALDELVRQVTLAENEGTVFILAGYRDQLERLQGHNPGLLRRFPVEIEFPGFTPAACAAYARRLLEADRLQWEAGVPERVAALAAEAMTALGDRFGNAGWVNGLVGQATDRMRRRVVEAGVRPGDPSRRRLALADLPLPHALPEAPDWTPAAGAAALEGVRPAWRTLPREDLVDGVRACTFQVITLQGGGEMGSATAFFVTPDGLAATSAHVVEAAREVHVLCGPGGAPRPARVVRADRDLDLALLAVEGPAPGYLPLGESRALRPPAELVVVGYAHVRPGEEGRAVLARVVRNERRNPHVIETDGALEPGFSGGPAVAPEEGGVVGVVMGGHGPSAHRLVRAEQLRELLAGLGYHFEPGE
ncbi:MAG TPA: AAA family ATPase [Longimicrobium sp.]|nr:AAA family ATPase [Longimicrobium sp.]